MVRLRELKDQFKVKYQKVFPSELSHLYEMLDFVKNYPTHHVLCSKNLDKIILATEEALVNIIQHAYSQQEKGAIEILCEEISSPSAIKIVIKDQGIPFNPLDYNSLPISSSFFRPNQHMLGGYGINLLKEVMDHVEYVYLDGHNQLTLTKVL